MQYIQDINTYKSEKMTAITLGKFDGVHSGHQMLIQRVCAHASENVDSVVFAFDMRSFKKEYAKDTRQLLLNEERTAFLTDKVDVLVECEFTQEIRNMTASDFVEKVLVQQFHAKYIVVGDDFRFGYKQSGSVEFLQACSEQYGFEVEVIQKKQSNGRNISSTYIREEIAKGHLLHANELLGYHYGFEGVVEHGFKLGRKLGFPTLNIIPPENKFYPPYGVYSCRIEIEGKWYSGIGNLGIKPTVSAEDKLLFEVHVFDFSKEIYGKRVRVELLKFERKELKFDSIEALKEQVDADINNCLQSIASML